MALSALRMRDWRRGVRLVGRKKETGAFLPGNAPVFGLAAICTTTWRWGLWRVPET